MLKLMGRKIFAILQDFFLLDWTYEMFRKMGLDVR